MKIIQIKRLLAVLLGVVFLTMALNAQNRDGKYIPKNLGEAISQLDILFPDSTKSQIINLTEEEFLGNSHFSIGMWIRNNWGLWKGKELAKYFNDLGVYHPDDMSGIILTSYYRHLHNQDLKVEEQVAYYQEYWRKSQEYNNRLESDTAFARQEKIKYENSIHEKNEKLKQDFPIGSQVKAWADYSVFGSRSQIIGEIVAWRTGVSRNQGRLGSSLKGPEVEVEYLEAKVKVVEYTDVKKKNKIRRRNHMENDELWVNVNLISKME